MTRMIELTDLMREDYSVMVPVADVARTIVSWYPADPHDHPADLDEINEFAEALAEEDYETARDIAAEIAVGFDMVQTTPDR